MIIVSASDDAFVPHFATLLHSVSVHAPQAEIYLLDCGIRPRNFEILRSFAVSLGVRLTPLKIELDGLSDLPATDEWPLASFARLLIPDLLPTADKALYLDADCVLVSGIEELWNENLDGYFLAGARDPGAQCLERRKFGLDIPTYINAGVLLLNLDLWRREDFATAVFAYIRSHKTKHPDQTALGAVGGDRIKLISRAWNFMTNVERRPPSEIHVVHYSGRRRPWTYPGTMLAAIYLHHRNQTPFPFRLPPMYRHRLSVGLKLVLMRKRYWRRYLAARRLHRNFARPYLRRMETASRG